MQSLLLQTWSIAIKQQPYFSKHPIHQPEIASFFCDAILHGRYDVLAEHLESVLEYLNGNQLSRDALIDSLFLLRDQIVLKQVDFTGLIAGEYQALLRNIQRLITELSRTSPLSDRLEIDRIDAQETANILNLMLKALENIGEGIVITEPRMNGNILFVNKALENMTGYPAMSLLGKPLLSLLDDNQGRELEKELFPAALNSGWNGDLSQQRSTGQPFPAHFHIQPVRDDDNDLLALVGILRDISVEKRNIREMEIREEQITRQNLRLKFLDDLSGIVNATLDIKETLSSFSQKFSGIFPVRALSFLLPTITETLNFRLFFEYDSRGMGHYPETNLVHLDHPILKQSGQGDLYFRLQENEFPDHEYFLKLRENQITELICFPIRFKDELLNVLVVAFQNFSEIDQRDLIFIEQITNHLTVALKNCMQFDQLDRQNRKLNFFYNLFSYIKNNVSTKLILNEALIDLAIAFSYDHLAVYQRTTDGEWQRLAHHSTQGISAGLFPQQLPADLDLSQTPMLHSDASELPEVVSSISTILISMKPGTLLMLRDASSIHGEILLLGVCNRHLPDLSHRPHLNLMQRILKELSLAMDHSMLFQQTIQAEQEWKMTFDEVQIGLAVVDRKFQIKRINKAFEEIFPTASKILPVYTHQFFEISEYEKSQIRDSSTGGNYQPQEWQDEKSGKSLIRQFFPLNNQSRQFIGGIFTIQDVTQRRLQEAHIRYLSRFPEVNPNIVLSLDLDGEVQYVNRTAQEIMAHLGLKNYKQIVPVQLLFDLKSREFQKGKSHEYLQKLVDRVIQYTAFAPEIGNTIYLYGMDTTERLNMQEKLLHTERMRTMGELASGAAHDFNNYLTTILGKTQFLMLSDLDEAVSNGLSIIEKATKDGAEMVRKLQELSHKKNRYNEKPLYLKDLINDSLLFSMQKIKPSMQVKGQDTTVILKLDEDIVVYGNPAEFREIFTNLILNAFDAMKEGGELFIDTHKNTVFQEAIIDVRDTGVGMSEEVRKQIFDPFYTTKGKDGTGLGLSVVYRIVTSLKGDISVTSKLNQGSVFTIRLPLSFETPQQEDRPILHLSSSQKQATQINLLVVDDEIDLLKTMVEFLKVKFNRVDMAISGEEALKKMKHNTYNVVISDLGMPEMSGWELASKVKDMSPLAKVVIVTGWGLHAEEELVNHEAYVDKVISKPYDLHQLLTIIEQMSEMGE